MKKCYLVREENIPQRAKFPVIDAHNHLWENQADPVKRVVEVMDQVGVACYCNLTANLRLEWANGGYAYKSGALDGFFKQTARYPHRFYGFTAATLAQAVDQPLFAEGDEFARRTAAMLREHVRQGARGLKVLKELGLHYRDPKGNLINLDDERLAPIWEEAGRLGVPVLMHQSDPSGFFEPITPENEHYESLLKYPTWSFVDAKFPRKEELLERRDRLLKRHRRTVFILPHVANYPENLKYVAHLLDENPNAYIDISARGDELGRQPYSAREFLIRYQDRVCFGTDMPASPEMYRFYFRFLETFDEYFMPPDYDGTFGRCRWYVCGLGLPDKVLEKIYYRNALKLIPGLAADFKSVCNES